MKKKQRAREHERIECPVCGTTGAKWFTYLYEVYKGRMFHCTACDNDVIIEDEY